MRRRGDPPPAASTTASSSRPTDREALERHAVTALGSKVTPGVGKAVVHTLEQRKLVKFNGTKIEYLIPPAKTNRG